MDDSTGNSAVLGAISEETVRVQTGRSKEGSRYSVGEEVANAITHGLGAALSIAALAILATLAGKRGDAWHVVSVAFMGQRWSFSTAPQASTTACPHPGPKRFFEFWIILLFFC